MRKIILLALLLVLMMSVATAQAENACEENDDPKIIITGINWKEEPRLFILKSYIPEIIIRNSGKCDFNGTIIIAKSWGSPLLEARISLASGREMSIDAHEKIKEMPLFVGFCVFPVDEEEEYKNLLPFLKQIF